MNAFHYRHHQLWVENVPLEKIVQTLGNCYVYSHASLLQQWHAFKQALHQQPHQICYALKANSNLAILNTFAQLGAGFDIVSQGELARVIAAQGATQQVVFSGVGKTPEEMRQALEKNIFCFNVESIAELEALHQVAQHLNLQAPIALRVNPDVDCHSHPYISTGLKENKFGIEMTQAPQLYQYAQTLPHLFIKGISCHIGSQLTSLAPFQQAFKRLFALIQQLKELGITLNHVNVGGGLGVRYQQETPPSIQDYVKTLLSVCPGNLMLIIEPGRSLVAPAGILVTKVLYLKQSGKKHYCIVDCAMNDLIRPTLYQAWLDIIPLQLSSQAPTLYDVVGPICESGDFLGTERLLAVAPHDYLAICNVGAYGFTMSSNYNSRPRLPEVLVKGAHFKVIRPRESIESLFINESIWP